MPLTQSAIDWHRGRARYYRILKIRFLRAYLRGRFTDVQIKNFCEGFDREIAASEATLTSHLSP